MSNDVFVEMECSQLFHDGEDVCGDDFLFERLEAENRHLAVLSDGLGSGIKANLLASMTTTMAMKFIRSDMDVLQSAEIIMDTLPVCEIRKISYATFTVFDLQIGGKSRIIEMDNPPFIHLRNNKDLQVKRQSMVSERWPDRRVINSAGGARGASPLSSRRLRSARIFRRAICRRRSSPPRGCATRTTAASTTSAAWSSTCGSRGGCGC